MFTTRVSIIGLSTLGGFLTMYWSFRAFHFIPSETSLLLTFFTTLPFIVTLFHSREFDATKLGLQLLSLAMIFSIATSYYFYFHNKPFGEKSYPSFVDFFMGPTIEEDGHIQSLEMILVPMYQLALVAVASPVSRWFSKRFVAAK
jgi:hypothetical protein